MDIGHTDLIEAAALREAREAAGLTRNELAAIAGIGAATVARIENGENAPTRATRKLLTLALQAFAATATP